MPDHNFLFIVEGDTDEPRFIKQLFQKCYSSVKFKTYTYRTNLHNLAKIIEEEYSDFEEDEIDIKLVLKSQEGNENKRRILEAKYTDIFLIFDFEPQQDVPRFPVIRRMLTYFNDSTNHGKLFINYPMMQSFKHFTRLPDPDFASLKIPIDDCRRYKQIVGEVSKYTDVTKYTYPHFMSIAVHHLRKANLIMSGVYETPKKEDYLQWNYVQIFDKQIEEKDTNNAVFVLNTCIFILVDYRPSSFFMQLLDRKQQFSI